MVSTTQDAKAAPGTLTLQRAASDLAIILVLSAMVIGLITFLHAVLPPIA